MNFKQFLLTELDAMGGMPPPPPMGGGMPPPPGAPPGVMPGGDPMAGGMPPMGGDPMMGGGMGGGMPPPGGDPMGGAPPGGAPLAPQIPLKMKVTDVWSVLDNLVKGKDSKDGKDSSTNQKKNMIQPPSGNKHLMA